MYTIIEHIEYLLTSHDCVVIPGWGALVAQYGDAQYDPVAGHIQRPRRELGFNASVDHNDGLLAQSLVRREGISYAEAMRFIGQSVDTFRQLLSQGNEVPLGRVGYFSSTDGRRIEFTPFNHKHSIDDYYGLADVAMRPLDELRTRHEAEAAFSDAVTTRRHTWGKRVIRTAASIALLLCLTILLTTPVIVNRSHHDYASLNLPSVTRPQQQVITETTASDKAQCATHDAQLPSSEAVNQSEEQPASPLLIDEGGNCLLVIASMTSPKQVDGFIQSHKDMAQHMQVQRVNKKLYYIYVARSYDAKRLYPLAAKLPRGYQGWVKS